MKIISWNVNGIRAVAKKGFLPFVQQQNADFFCVQETKAHPDQVEVELRSPFGQHAFWSAAKKKGYSGVATFAKDQPLNAEHGIGMEEYDSEGRIVITATKEFDLYNIYFPNGGSGEDRHNFKQKFLKDLLVHLQAKIKVGRQIILVGDYNVAHRAVDVYDPIKLDGESGFMPEEREWFDRFLAAGFVDTFRHFYPEAKNRYSWWSYREMAKIGNRGWRIDYICVSKGLVGRLKSADILDRVEGSDHCPVVLELQ